MKRAFQIYAFVYGVGSACALAVWFLAAYSGFRALPNNVVIVEAAFGLHALAALITFQPQSTGPPASRLFTPTHRARVVASWAIGVVVALFTVVLIASVAVSIAGNRELQESLLPLVLISFLLTNSVYFAAHAAIGPESIFSSGFIRWMSNPIGEFILHMRKR